MGVAEQPRLSRRLAERDRDGGSDWVQVVTWSDFSESGEIEPYTDATLAPQIGTGFYDLNAYYASWFLTGKSPAITHDILYYFYRRGADRGRGTGTGPTPTTAVLAGGGPGVDSIELLGFLTAPGTLTVTVNGQTMAEAAPAGVTSFTVPLQPGVPTFGLQRDGGQVISFSGGVEVCDAGGLDSGTLDLTYWTGSASAAGVCALSVSSERWSHAPDVARRAAQRGLPTQQSALAIATARSRRPGPVRRLATPAQSSVPLAQAQSTTVQSPPGRWYVFPSNRTVAPDAMPKA